MNNLSPIQSELCEYLCRELPVTECVIDGRFYLSHPACYAVDGLTFVFLRTIFYTIVINEDGKTYKVENGLYAPAIEISLLNPNFVEELRGLPTPTTIRDNN